MNQLARLWSSLSRAQQISLVIAPLLVLAAVSGILKWKHDSDFRVLYSSLAPEDASAVTQKIREAGIEYRLDETGATVMVPSEHLAEARLALAGAGLPRSGRIGFELFDRNNLGASDFTEQVNYRRALEGELERTVATLSAVDQARIHITFAKESVFLDAQQPSKATVVLRLKRSAQLPQGTVTAVANLVASAVEGLAPDAVAIIDSNGHLLNRPHATGDAGEQLAVANLDYRQQVETELLTRINSALNALLGPDRFRASVNVDCDFTSSEQNDEIVDSDHSAVLTSLVTEESTGAALAGGTPGTASNLPKPPERASAGGTGMLRRTENKSFQPSRTVKHTISPRGNVRRISTAVLVDQTVRWEGAGAKARRVVVPPSAEVMKGVHDLIAGITGFTEQRGDQITVETLPFENTLETEPPAAPVPAPKTTPGKFSLKQPLVLSVIGGLGLLIVLGGAFLFLKRSRVSVQPGAPEIAAGAKAEALQSPEIRLDKQIQENQERQAQLESEALSRIKMPVSTRKTEVLVKHIRESVTKDATNATNVLRTWISDVEGKRT